MVWSLSSGGPPAPGRSGFHAGFWRNYHLRHDEMDLRACRVSWQSWPIPKAHRKSEGGSPRTEFRMRKPVARHDSAQVWSPSTAPPAAPAPDPLRDLEPSPRSHVRDGPMRVRCMTVLTIAPIWQGLERRLTFLLVWPLPNDSNGFSHPLAQSSCRRQEENEKLIAVTATIPPWTDHRCTASMPWATRRSTAIAPATDTTVRANGSSPRSAAPMAAPGAASRKKSVNGPRREESTSASAELPRRPRDGHRHAREQRDQVPPRILSRPLVTV